MRFLSNFFYSFPVQLVVMHIKKHHLLLFFWALLFIMISGELGSSFGIHYLMLDPEYLGHVDFVGFSILGAAVGGYIITWNITTYILESYHFPFLATFDRPFAVYCLNNSLLPLAYIAYYLYTLINFQSKSQLMARYDIFMDVAGYLGGLLSIIFFAALYFQTTNRNVFSLFGKELSKTKVIAKRVVLQEDKHWRAVQQGQGEFRVDVYLSFNMRLRYTRSVKHYEDKVLRSVFRQNHFNAFMIEMVSILLILGFGSLIDYKIFRIPAAASGILFFSILVASSGMLDFWLKGWKSLFIIALAIVLNIIMLHFGQFSYKNKAYGLKYKTKPAEYSYANLNAIASPDHMRLDMLNTIAILDAWKAHTGERKPKLVVMNFSGGGLSSATFSTAVIQKVDSVLHGKLFNHTVLMTGASGGMIGAAYLRELYLMKQQNTIPSIYSQTYTQHISQDLLNSIIFTSVTNDIFYPWQTFKVNNNTYHKDRGYIFEQQLNENTGNVMKHTISEYDQYEKAGIIPMMVLAPTIINDQRRLLISAQPVSYLMRPIEKNYTNDTTDIDGVDFRALFAKQDADSLQMTSAVRMNATYPYILPYVAMPSEPMIKVMDAGLRDNYGLETSLRFLRVFRRWIQDNTSGVVVIQVRQYKKQRELEDYRTETILSNLLTPVTNLYSNLTTVQDYEQASQLSDVYQIFNGKVQLINFEFAPANKTQETSLSFHLTAKEKKDIIRTVNQPNIELGIERLKYEFGVKK